jgi:uncharacterized protein related to proFAR isomerase
MIGKPLDVARDLKAQGYKLIHIIDGDALAGLQNNLDVYNSLTYIINVQVECAQNKEIITKLLSLKCRVILPPTTDVSTMSEKRLLVTRISASYSGKADGFHDVVLENADEEGIKHFTKLKKRVIIYEKDFSKLDAGCRKLVWGVIKNKI